MKTAYFQQVQINATGIYVLADFSHSTEEFKTLSLTTQGKEQVNLVIEPDLGDDVMALIYKTYPDGFWLTSQQIEQLTN